MGLTHLVKSKPCSDVLKLMDKDLTYSEALQKVLAENPNVNRVDLEEELNYYV